jgi:hypothetical protein
MGDVVWHRQIVAEFMVELPQRRGSNMTANIEAGNVKGEGDHEGAAVTKRPTLHLPKAAVAHGAAKPTVEDESADPVGDGHSDADFAAQLPLPGVPNPAPDQGDGMHESEDGEPADDLGDEGDLHHHEPMQRAPTHRPTGLKQARSYTRVEPSV